MKHDVAQRVSLKQWGQYWNRETTRGERQKQSPISRQRDRSVCVRDFAYNERTIRRSTKHIKDRHLHGLCNIAREKAEHKRSLKNETCHLVQYGDTDKAERERSDGVLVRPRHRTTSATVCVLRAHLYGLR